MRGDQQDARRFRTARIAERDRGWTQDATADITLAAYLEHWLATVARATFAAATFYHAVVSLRSNVVPYIGNTRLSHLKLEHFTALRTRLTEQGGKSGRGPLSATSVQRIFGFLHSALTYAVAEHRLISHPMQGLPKRKRVQRPRIDVLSEEQAAKVYAEAGNHLHGDIIRLAMVTGMRLSELIGLQVRDVQLLGEDPHLELHQSLQSVARRGWVEGPLKSESGARDISLGTRAAALVREILAKRRMEGPPVETDLLFVTSRGTPVNPTTIRRTYQRILARAGVGHHTFHALRHTHATLLLRRGIPIDIVSRRLGHASVAFTLSTYIHAVPDMERAMAARIDETLNWAGASADGAADDLRG